MDEIAWCYTFEFRLIYCDDWGKKRIYHLGRAFCLPFRIMSFFKAPADRMIQCCTVAQSLSIYFLHSITLCFWC